MAAKHIIVVFDSRRRHARNCRVEVKHASSAADMSRMKSAQGLGAPMFVVLVVVALFAFPQATSAQPYATAAAGASHNNIDCTTSLTCEKTDVAFKLIGGYRVAPWIAAEAVYLDFGAGEKTNRISVDTLKSSAFGGGVAVHANMASWAVTARVGAAWASAKRTITLLQTRTDSLTFSDVAPYGGAGISYRFSDVVALTLGVDAMRSKWERSDGVGMTWLVTAATAGITIGR